MDSTSSKICFLCGRPERPRQPLCECGGAWTSGACYPSESRIVQEDLPYPWSVLGAFPEGNAISLTGRRGGGKSSLCAYLLRHYRSGLWVTSEQSGYQVGLTVHRVTPDHTPLVYPCNTIKTALNEINSTRGLVVVDSLTALAEWSAQVEFIETLKKRGGWLEKEGNRLIVILQQNGAGEGAGHTAIPHLVDAVLEIDTAHGISLLKATKNRNGPEGALYFTNGASGIEKPAFKWAYSVEGPKGNYSLHPYPLPGAKYDGFLKKIEEKGTLPTGVASAAIPCKSYCYQPEDTAQRRIFAENHGLAWVDPETYLEENHNE